MWDLRQTVDERYSNIARIWTLIFECYVVTCGSKNGHQKDMWLQEIGPCAQDMVTILGPEVNMIGGPI